MVKVLGWDKCSFDLYVFIYPICKRSINLETPDGLVGYGVRL